MPHRQSILLAAVGIAAGYTCYRTIRKRPESQEILVDHTALTWTPPSRSTSLAKLKSQTFDLLIIGGGATGTGCALDAASRGLDTACIDALDWSGSTSSKSTKLVHGGVRYLEKAFKEFDFDQFKLVREALDERAVVLKTAPHLTSLLPIMLPLYSWLWAPYYIAGAKVYDWVAGVKGLQGSFVVDQGRALQEFPLLKQSGLIGALVYYDGQQDDARMGIALALTAARYGAAMANYVKVDGLVKENGRIVGVKAIDQLTKEEFTIKAKGVVNATGPYCDAIRQMDDPLAKPLISASAGVHIVMPEYYSPRDMGLIDPSTRDGRVLFFLPWQYNTLAGTTDAPATVSDLEPTARAADIDYILDEVREYLDPRVRVRRCDVVGAWAGLRPLVRDPTKVDTQSIVRNHIILTSDSGLITITGGKWTTYRKMAEECIDRAVDDFQLATSSPCRTKQIGLIGSQGYDDLLYIQLIQQFGFETDVAKHLASAYGDRAVGVAMIDIEHHRQGTSEWPILGNRLIPYYPYIEAEIRWAVRNEYAMTISDVLCRRMRLGFHNCRAANSVISRVADVMAEELQWSEEQRLQEVSKAEQQMQSAMGLSSLSPMGRTESSQEQLQTFCEKFKQLGATNGWVSVHEIDSIIPTKDFHQPFISLGDFLTAIHNK